MKKLLLYTGLWALLIFVQCKEDPEVDPNYPTVVEQLEDSDINQIVYDLQQSPMVFCQTVDQYGFPSISFDDTLCINEESWIYNATTKELIDSAKSAIFRYGNFLNVIDTSKIEFLSIISNDNVTFEKFYKEPNDSGPPAWILTTRSQVYDGYEVSGTNLKIILAPDHIAGIGGHWYTNIYVPTTDNYSEEAAKESLINRTFTYSRNEIIPTNDMTWHETKKVIIPVRRADTIELRVCWALHPSTWEIAVDTQNGEVITCVDISSL